MYFIDTETYGLCGPIVTIQYAEDDGPTVIHNVWLEPIEKTLQLLEDLADVGVIGFNLTFDWFQINKLYSMFKAIGLGNPLDTSVHTWAKLEKLGRDYTKVLKPRHACDLYLTATKGQYNKCMRRKKIEIKRVPAVAASILVSHLEENLYVEPILTAKKKTEARWSVQPSKDKKGRINQGFVDLTYTFAPSLSLKDLVVDLGIDNETIKFEEAGFTDHPVELNFAPYALAFKNIEDNQWPLVVDFLKRKKSVLKDTPYYGAWPDQFKDQIDFWASDRKAIEYAIKDVEYTRAIYRAFDPVIDDLDSTLACCIACCRWKGYRVDTDGLRALRARDWELIEAFPNHTKSRVCNAYISEYLGPETKKILGAKSDEATLKKVIDMGGEAGIRAQKIMDAREAAKEINMIDKLLIADRLHASFNVFGAKSSRMSGADGLNPQGIKRDKYFRALFPLRDGRDTLSGGDFKSFEVALTAAVSKDERLIQDLQSGKKIHGIFGTFVFPDYTYEEIVASEGSAKDLYSPSKSAMFAMIYGGDENTIANRMGVELEVAEEAYHRFLETYTGANEERESINYKYTALAQGMDGVISWHTPATEVSSIQGFVRSFEVEWNFCRQLYEIAGSLPHALASMEGEVVRSEHKGPQKVMGACMSAIYAAAFNIQSAIIRQAANHRIQSSGAIICKELQAKIWDLQPSGAYEWLVQPMNIHDELMVVNRTPERLRAVVDEYIESQKPIVPLIAIDWHEEMDSWAEK